MIPAWRRFLPRPGAWMKRLEELLAFPLYASVAWLVWVLSQQAGPTAVAAALGRPRSDRARGVALPGFPSRARGVASRGSDRGGRAGGGRGGPRPARRHGTGPGSGRGAGRPGGGLQSAAPRRAACAGSARVRERHRRLVHHLSRERARGPPLRRGGRGVREEGRGRAQGRLDEPRRRHRRDAGIVRAQRRSPLPAVCAGRRRAAGRLGPPPCSLRFSPRER